MGSGLHWILCLLENIRKGQGCYVNRYQSLKIRIGIEGKMECQKEEQHFSEAGLCCVSCCQLLLEQVKSAETWLRACTVDGGEWSASCSDHFTHRGRVLSTHSVGGWVGLQQHSGDYGEKKNLYLVLCPVLPACSWTVLYWLQLMFQHILIIKYW